MTNHDRFALAFQGMQGKILRTREIKSILLTKFPYMNPGSMLPNDHAKGNKSPCSCASKPNRIFDRIDRGLYKVRPNL